MFGAVRGPSYSKVPPVSAGPRLQRSTRETNSAESILSPGGEAESEAAVIKRPAAGTQCGTKDRSHMRKTAEPGVARSLRARVILYVSSSARAPGSVRWSPPPPPPRRRLHLQQQRAAHVRDSCTGRLTCVGYTFRAAGGEKRLPSRKDRTAAGNGTDGGAEAACRFDQSTAVYVTA